MKVPTNQKLSLFRHAEKRLHFLHVPKCGGSFVEKAFLPWIKKCETRIFPETAGHLTYQQYESAFARIGIGMPDLWFTVIRNPWDWHVSWFHYIKGDPTGKHSGCRIEGALFQSFTFSDYIRWLEDPSAPATDSRMMHKQMKDYLTDADSSIAVSRILRQESLAEDLDRMIQDLDLKTRIPKGRKNTSRRETDYRVHYTDKEAEVVARRHADDLELFHYRFDPPASAAASLARGG